MNIPIAKPVLGKEEKKQLFDVLRSGILTNGPKVRKFERKFATYTNVKHAIAVSSGTAALHAILCCMNLKKHDEIITTPFTFVASANMILCSGGTPVFADIDYRTFNIDPNKIKRKITKRTKAILVVHLYGQPADMSPILEIAKTRDIIVIEDACQSHGGEYKKLKVGSIGDVGCFSFYPTKNMTTGEGGMITTQNEELAKKIRTFIDQGQRGKYEYVMLGVNYRMSEFSAGIGIEQLNKLDELNKIRAKNASYLTENLESIKNVELPYVNEHCKHVWHVYTVKTDSKYREKLVKYLQSKGIDGRIYYPKVLYEYPHIRPYKCVCETAEIVSKRVLSLPVHPKVTITQLQYISKTIKNFF